MTDKQAQSDSTDKTPNKQPESVKAESNNAESSKPSAKAAPKASGKTTTSTQPQVNGQQPKKRSKTAVLALVCAVVALGGLAAGYVWQNQQNMALMEGLVAQNKAQLNATEQQLQRLINQQQNNTLTSAQRMVADSLTPIQAEVAKLAELTQALQQNDPTDWLVHEAEYLIRIASRAMWLEKDTQVAIDLLQDADLRIKELNDPELLPVRQLINQDIESLKLLPELATEDVILKLIGLSNQINELPIAMAHLPEATQAQDDFELSESTADWQENLAKTWQKFMADFITVKRRTANVEALLTPSQQQNLRQNLQLKLQLSQWAASQHKAELFDTSLSQAQAWLVEYFDMDNESVVHFHRALELLKSEIIQLTLPEKLDSLQAIRGIIKRKPRNNSPMPKLEAEPTEATAPKEHDAPTTSVIKPVETTEDENGAII